MVDDWTLFESIVRNANSFTEASDEPLGGLHPFDQRNIHSKIEKISKKLFDDGHYSQATFEAYKLIDKEVQTIASTDEIGTKLMMNAFNEENPQVKLNDLINASEKDEQKGYKFIFSGTVMAIRNPRAHEVGLKDSATLCLDHLSLASLLLRRIEDSKSLKKTISK